MRYLNILKNRLALHYVCTRNSSSRITKRGHGLALLAALFISVSPPAPAGSPGATPDKVADMPAQRDFHGNDLSGKDGPLAKVGLDLARLYREQSPASRRSGIMIPANPLASVVQSTAGVELVVIDAVAENDAKALRATLEALGLQQSADYGRMVSGLLPVSAIGAMAALPNLRLARLAAAVTKVGSTTSQGDLALRANTARAQYGFDGAGVVIASMSDSYNCLGGAPADVASGDLPAGVTVLRDNCPGTDEGRALIQVIRDIAPAATQAFRTAMRGQADYAAGIAQLAAAPVNAKVIVDDVVYLTEPFFQDGIVAQAVDKVVAGGTAYFSAAGNYGRDSYQSMFRLSSTLGPGGGLLHDFDPGPAQDVLQSVTIPVGDTARFAFQWDQPFFSVSGPPGAASDLDILLIVGNSAIAGGTVNNLGGDAAEFFSYTNNGPNTQFSIAIERFSGASPGLVKYVILGGASINQFATHSPTTFGHPNANGAETVGAAFYADTPPCGVTPPLLEPTSSAGGVPILFDLAGSRLATPLTRQKPEVVGPDGVNNTFFGQAITDPAGPCSSTEPFPNFGGTSSSAPHVAAVAALMRHANPDITPAAIYANMEKTATNMGPPGFDFDSGFGLVQANLAIAASIGCNGAPATIIGTAAANILTGTPGADIISGLGGDDTINGLGGNDLLCGGVGNDTLDGGEGSDTLLGEFGNDRLTGGNGGDTASFAGGAAVTANIAAGAATGQGSDTLTSIESLTGSGFNDSLTGNTGNNTLNGGLGNDTLNGGLGNDILNGMAGVDTVFFPGTAAVNVNLSTGTAGGQGSDMLFNFENVTGSSGNDSLTGNAFNNILNGGSGNDTLDGAAGNDSLLGGIGNDTLNGGANTDTCNGETGTDSAVNCETVLGVP